MILARNRISAILSYIVGWMLVFGINNKEYIYFAIGGLVLGIKIIWNIRTYIKNVNIPNLTNNEMRVFTILGLIWFLILILNCVIDTQLPSWSGTTMWIIFLSGLIYWAVILIMSKKTELGIK